MSEHVVVGLGAAAAGLASSPTEIALGLAHHHPSNHGALRLRLQLDGDRITECEPVVGYMHRGVEKLFEVRDYRQIIVLANRHDWLSAFASELGFVLAVERMVGLEVPARATWARTLLAELNRVLSHLTFLAGAPAEDTATVAAGCLGARESVQRVMEELSGGRMHFMFNRVGGLKEDLPRGWLDRVERTVREVRTTLPRLEQRVLADAGFVHRTRGVGVLTASVAEAYGVSGPVARGSGLNLDLRRDDPYLAYPELTDVLRVVIREAGDAEARYQVLLEQVDVSLDLADACVDRLRALPRGPISVRLPKIVRAPEGSTYVWTESPAGINGYYLVSRGEKTPWRLKLRTASFNNVSVLPEIVPGLTVVDLVPVLGSLFYVVGDIDK